MKKLAILLSLFAFAIFALANVTTYFEGTVAGSDIAQATSSYKELGTVTANVATSAIKLSGYHGIYVRTTGTAGALVQFSENTTASNFRTIYRIGPDTYYFIRKHAPYIRFVGFGPGYVTIRYLLAAPSVVTVLGVSNTSRVVSGPTTINLTHVAGVFSPITVIFGTRGKSSVGMLWAITGSSNWPGDNMHYLAVSATPILRERLAPGMHLHLSPTSASDQTTAVIQIESEAVQ